MTVRRRLSIRSERKRGRRKRVSPPCRAHKRRPTTRKPVRFSTDLRRNAPQTARHRRFCGGGGLFERKIKPLLGRDNATMQAVRAEREKAVPTRQKRRRQERKNRLRQRQPRRNRGGANQRACNEEQNLFRRKQGGKGGTSRRRTRFSSGARAERVRKRETKTKKGIGLLPIPLFSPSRERRLFSRSFRPRAARSPLARDFLPDAVGKSSGVRIRERRSFFRFMVFTTHHCRRLFQKVIRDESILTLFNHFVTSCRLNPRFRDIFLFLYRFAFSPLINSESLSGSRSFCARISCAFYCADLTPSDLKAQSLRFRS